MEYTVTITNNTGEQNKAYRYIAFGLPHKTKATRGDTGLPVVFYRSDLLNDGDQDQFTISSAVFGFLGNGSQTNANLTAKGNVSLRRKLPATVGTRAGNGTELEAKPSSSGSGIDFTDSGTSQSASGTFSIIVNNGVSEGNLYAVGLARKVDDNHKPIVAFPMHPGQVFDIKPEQSIYIARDDDTNTGTLVKVDDFTLRVQVDLVPNQPKAAVTNDSTALKVSYR